MRGVLRRAVVGAFSVTALVGATLSAVIVVPATTAAADGVTIIGLRKNGTTLVRMSSTAPESAVDIPIAGVSAGDPLRGIDVRPSDGQLLGISANGTSYRINPRTGVASDAVTSATAASGDLGYDVNPLTGLSREVGSTGANVRHNPDTGQAVVDVVINPAGFTISGIAYTPAINGGTTLFGIDSTANQLVRIGGVNGSPSPNGGSVTIVGTLGVDTTNDIGFDISPAGAAFASLSNATQSHLYGINLANGAAVDFGAIPGAPLSGLAVAPADPFTRLFGADRIDTAVATSTNSFPTPGSAAGVVLARADVAADALSGTPLAKIVGGPLLLTASGVLDGRTQAEIQRVLGPTGKTVHLLGGTAALNANVESQIKALGYNTVRHGGTDRFDTARLIAEALGSPGTVFLADGTGFADALVAGVAATKTGGAVLLTQGTTLPPPTSAYLNAHPGSRFTFGPSSTAFPGGTAITGSNPFERSAAAAAQFWPTPAPTVGVASGEEFPDGLTGGAHIAKLGGPLLLVTTSVVPAAVDAYLEANRVAIDAGFLYGGPVRINDVVLGTLQADIS